MAAVSHSTPDTQFREGSSLQAGLKVLLLFVLLIAGIVVGPMIAGHQGYVLIQTDNYNIETSVTGLAIILILAMVVLFFC